MNNQKITGALDNLVKRILAQVSGKTVQSMVVDSVTGELIIYYTDSSEQNLGRIFGDDGATGAGVLDLQLYPDPGSPGDVYLQTTLTNGIVLRTRDSLKGWDGKGLDSAYISNNHIHFVLDDGLGTELTPIPVNGLTAISITGANIVAGELIFNLSDGGTLTAGIAEDLAGRGITSATITNSNLILKYSDAPDVPVDLGRVVGDSVVGTEVREGNLFFQLASGTELDAGSAAALAGVGVDEVKLEDGKLKIKYSNSPTFVDLGGVDGVASLRVVDGKLVYAKSSAPNLDIEIATFSSILGMEVVGNELFALTNQPAPNDRINLGPVANLKGDPGVGISTAVIANNVLTLTLTNNAEIDLPVGGLAPVVITGARYDSVADEIFFILGDGSEVSSGIKEDMRGEGLNRVEMSATGVLTVYYDRAPTVGVELATIKYLTEFYVENGKIWAKYNTAPTTPVELGTILGVSKIVSEAGVIKVKYTDGTESTLGELKGIKSVTVDNAYNLVITYSDNSTHNAGLVRGTPGADGASIIGAVIDGSGDLILSTSKGETINAGQARIDIDNIIGSVKRFVATAAQAVYNVAHSGEAAVFVDGVLAADSRLDLSAGDSIRFDPPFVGGEQVVVMAFAPTGSVITGKGVQGVTEVSPGVFEVELENGVKYSINTVTPIDPDALPPKITGMTIDQTSHLIITFSDETTIDAGFTANANSITTAKVNPSGDLILTLTDLTTINCGSVMSNLAISNAVIDENGHLIITMNSGGVFDSGVTGAYVVSAAIDANDGHLRLTLNTGTIVDAGAVVNPLLGTFIDVIAFEGQTEFSAMHAGHRVLFFANGILLNESRLNLTDPTKVITLTPRKDQDVIRIVLMSTGGVFVKGLESEALAQDNTYYGKVGGVVGFHPVGALKVATPLDFVANPGQTVFNNIPHTGMVEIFKDGQLVTTGFQTPPEKVIFTVPLVGGELIRINSLSAPKQLGAFVKSNYCRVANSTYENGGSFTGKTWLGRQLNVLEDNALGAMLNKNNIILPAGTYYIRGWVANFGIQANATRLYSNNERKVLLNSAVQYSEGMSKTFMEGYFTLGVQSSIALQQYGLKSVGTFGLGKCGDGTAGAAAAQQAMGLPMTHCELNLWKVD